MKGYGQFCPVAKAAEIFGERWTPLIVRELIAGSHRFNELRRGNPLMSPSILSQRLKSLEDAGIVERRTTGGGGARDSVEYHLTEAGRELGPIVMQLGHWGHKYARSQLTPDDFDPALLMWDLRRRLDASGFAPGRTVVQVEFTDAPRKTRYWWLDVNDGEVDLCMKSPGHEVDLHLRCRVETLSHVWMGHQPVRQALASGELQVTGPSALIRAMDEWLGFSVFAHPEST